MARGQPRLRSRAARAARSRRTGAALAAALALLAFGIAGAVPAAAAAATVRSSASAYSAHVAEAAQRFGIPDAWIWRVMHAESRGNPRAVSRAGAMGLMQVMPATWAMLTARHRLGSDPFDARANIHAGAAYLRQMWDRYRDVRLMLAAYNAGPGRADAYAAGRRGLPAETIAYVAKIAPELGASAGSPVAGAVAADPPLWRSSGLFAGQKDGAASAPQPPSDQHSVGEPPVAAKATSLLFVPLSGRGE